MKIITSQHIESESRHLFINYEAATLDSILLITDVDSIDTVPPNRIRILSSDTALKLNLRNYIPLIVEKSISIGPFEIKMIENVNDELFSYFIKDASSSLLVVTNPPFIPYFTPDTSILLARSFPKDCEEILSDYRQFFVQKKPEKIYCMKEECDLWLSVVHDKRKLISLPQEIRQLSLF